MTTTRTAYVDSGDLYDYRTGDYLRPATEDEERRSMEAAETDGGAGAVEIVDPAKVRPEDVRVGDWADDRYPEPYRAAYVGECVLTDPDQAGMTDEDLRAEAIAELRRAGALDEGERC